MLLKNGRKNSKKSSRNLIMEHIGNYNLGFISNEDIYNHVKDTVMKYSASIDLKKFNTNIVDPIKLTFDMKVYQKSINEVIESECMRQMDKTNSNHIGYFHQNIFKYARNGWEVPANGETGFDVENRERHLFIELKNKHNTMNSSSAKNTYIKMQNKILHDDQATCMLVEVIAKKSQNIKWKTTIDGDLMEHERIRRVSIDNLYAMAFSDDLAFMKLCKQLPNILDDVISNNILQGPGNTVLTELQEISPDILKSLYMFAFNTYDGFSNF